MENTKMNLGISTTFYGIDFGKYSSHINQFVDEFASRANKKGQFFDVGIAEQTAVSMTCGIAKGGGNPVLGVYAVARSLSSRRAGASCGARGKWRIGFWFLMTLVLFVGLVVWRGTGDAVERQFKWLYKMPDFKYEVLQREEDIVHEYRVPVRFLQALQKEDMSRHGFSSWEKLNGAEWFGGYKVTVGFSDLDGPVYISREMTRGGMRELHAAVIAFSVKEGRLVLYCPRF